MIYNVFIVILVTIYHCCIMYNMKNAELQGCMGQNVHTGLPLALGRHPGERCEPPISYAVLFFLPVSIKHLMKKLMGVGLVPTPCLYFPMSNSFFYLRKHEGHALLRGSV